MTFDVICNGDNNGKICVDMSVPTLPAIINIYDKNTGISITNLSTPSTSPTGVTILVVPEGISVDKNGKYCWDTLKPGSYILEIKDSSSSVCYVSALITINEPESLDFTYTIEKIECGAKSNLQINPKGGNIPYKINLTKVSAPSYPSTTNYTGYFTNLTGDNINPYNITITDFKGCTKTSSIIVDASSTVSMSVGYKNILCNGSCSGEINVLVTKGVSPFIVNLYSNPKGSYVSSTICSNLNCTNYVTFNSLCAGSYIVEVIDSLGCIVTTNVTITQPSPILLNGVTVTQITCTECCDGTIIVDSITGGIGPYLVYLINELGEQTNYTNTDGVGPAVLLIENLKAGNYTLYIQDANGCIVSYKFTINKPINIIIE